MSNLELTALEEKSPVVFNVLSCMESLFLPSQRCLEDIACVCHAVETDLYLHYCNSYTSSGLWAVLNTACLCCKGRLENQESSHWDAMLKYNVIGTLRTARTFMPLLKNKRGKSIHYVGQAKYVPPNLDPDIRIYSI
jgi:NAD(P)-dependent dehydrogenase (short-subunit alcohol dehydrogenase family)